MEKQAIPQRPKDNNKRLPVSENMHEIVITKRLRKKDLDGMEAKSLKILLV